MRPERIVIVGGGLAAATAAFALREHDYAGEIVVVGAEADFPYNRPPLSKGFLRREETFSEILVRQPEDYRHQDIKLRLGTAVGRARPHEHTIELVDGEELEYSQLLIATGGRNRELGIDRVHLRGIYSLRTLADSERIREEAVAGKHAVVVGLGFIGSEVTASLRQLGVGVTAIEPAPTPLNRVLGDRIGMALADIHRAHDVELLLSDAPVEFEGDVDVTAVRTRDGRIIHCDFAVVGVGIQPNVEFLEGSGVGVSNGIVVDEFLRTNAPDVFAAGDVANHYNPLFAERMRLEHWNNAERQGRLAAESMLSMGTAYAVVPSFWSDQYDLTLEYRGHHTSWDEVVVRGDLRRSFVAFFVKDQRMRSALALNRDEELAEAERLIATKAIVSLTALADEATALASTAA